MPRLPELDGARPGLRPQTGYSGIGRQSRAGEIMGEATARLGQEISNFGTQLANRYQAEQEKQDRTVAESEFNAIRESALDLTAGEKGYERIQGADAVNGKLLDDYTKRFDDVSGKSLEKLNDRQRELLKPRIEVARLQYREGILQHTTQQNKVFGQQTFEATLNVEERYVAANYDQPTAVGTSILRVESAVKDQADRLGYSETTKEGKLIRDEMLLAARGKLHETVINQAISEGATGYANEYYAEAKGGMTTDQRKAIEAKLKPATDWQQGKTLASQAFARLEAGDKPKDVEKWLLDNSKTPGEHTAAQSMLRQLETAAKVQDAEQRGGLLEQFSATPTRAGMNKLLGSLDYLSMGQEQRGTLAEYMRNQVEQNENAGRAKRAEQWENPKVFTKFMDTLDDPRFPSMSRSEIYALAPEIGPTMTNKLLAEHRAITEGQRRFQIDKDILGAGIPTKLAKATTESEKNQLNAFKGLVESNLMDWKQANPGKLPTPEQQQSIVRSATKDYVAFGAGIFGSDKTVPAYQVKEGMKAVPKDFVDGLRARAQAKGRELTEEQILQAWKLSKGGK